MVKERERERSLKKIEQAFFLNGFHSLKAAMLNMETKLSKSATVILIGHGFTKAGQAYFQHCLKIVWIEWCSQAVPSTNQKRCLGVPRST